MPGFRKAGYLVLVWFLAVGATRNAGAARFIVKIAGTVASGTDTYGNVFSSSGVSTNLTGLPFTLTYTLDTAFGTTTTFPCNGMEDFSETSGTDTSPNAILTIQGKAFTIGGGGMGETSGSWFAVRAPATTCGYTGGAAGFSVSAHYASNGFSGDSAVNNTDLGVYPATGLSFGGAPNWWSFLPSTSTDTSKNFNFLMIYTSGSTSYNASGLLSPQTISIGNPGSEAGVFRDGFLWILDADGNYQFDAPPDKVYAFGGIAGDIPITGDWSGSGTTKLGIYRPANGLFILDYNGDGMFEPGIDKVYSFGIGQQPGDIPVTGDWNGSGTSKIGLFRDGYFWILDTNGDGVFDTGDQSFAFGGIAGDVPVVGDWNGSGTSKVGVFRSGFLWILDTNGDHVFDTGDQVFAFGGIPGDIPVVGDWNGDGRGKAGVFREGFFWVLDTNGNQLFDYGSDQAFPYGGIAGDLPVVGKW
jgi:hypothetical protein